MGGMGEVVAARDRRMARSVALKRMRHVEPTDDEVARFLREAQIQARLDHPAIVPVYEPASTTGLPYFTMRRLAGTTLLGLIGKAELGRLLRAFVETCLAIELAHTRGVVHRDLKPANMMLGDFGEVFVLDWASRVCSRADVGERRHLDVARPHRRRRVLGTPGYMSPEQARGEPVGPAGDVYALGCILFEILAHEPLHPREGALVRTLEPHDGSPARRRPKQDIAPELDAACVAALAALPDERPTARELRPRPALSRRRSRSRAPPRARRRGARAARNGCSPTAIAPPP